jgi:hypothetical protein
MNCFSQSPVTFPALSRDSFSVFLDPNARRTPNFPLDYKGPPSGAIAIPSYNRDGCPTIPNVGSDNHNRHRGFKEKP